MVLFAAAALAQGPTGIAKLYDGELTSAEREIVPLAEAMPADAYQFAPKDGSFTGVRTFALQVRHLATVLYEVSAAAMEKECPVSAGKNENGSDELKSKEQIVQYLKDAFAYAHKAAGGLTAANEMQPVKSPFGSGTIPRLRAVSIAVWHSYDHYGQMVVYARMNRVIPPASR